MNGNIVLFESVVKIVCKFIMASSVVKNKSMSVLFIGCDLENVKILDKFFDLDFDV